MKTDGSSKQRITDDYSEQLLVLEPYIYSKKPDTSNNSVPLNYVEQPKTLVVRSTVDEDGFVPTTYNEQYSEETSDQ